MPVTRIEVPTGAIDGSNRDFSLSRAYVTGQLYGIINGLMRIPVDDDGIIEVDPDAGTFQTRQTLKVGQTLEAQFLDTSPVGSPTASIVGSVVAEILTGEISAQQIEGTISP